MRETLVANLNPRILLSWPVFLITLFWAMSTNLLDRINNPNGHYPERFIAVFSGHLVLFALLFLALLVITRMPKLFQSVLMIPLVAMLAALRGLVVLSVMMSFGFDTESLFAFRVFGSITNVGFPMVLTAVSLQRIRTFSKTRSQLEQEKSRLLELRDLGSQRIRQESDARLQQIKQIILRSLESNLGANYGNIAAAISQTLEQIVRPLSHQVESEKSQLAQKKVEFDARVDWPLAIREAFSPKFLKPVVAALVFTTVAMIFSFTSFQPVSAVTLLSIVGLGSYLTVTALKKSLTRLEPLVSKNLIPVIVVLGLILSGFVIGFGTLIVTQDLENPFVLFPLPAYLLTGISLLLAFATSAQQQAKAAIDQLGELTQELAWEVARINEEDRQRRMALVSLLHGRFQSAFMSSILRIRADQALKNPADGPIADQVLRELKELVATVGIESRSGTRGLQAIFQALQTTWEGVAVVSWATPNRDNQLEKDSQLMETLSDLIPELTFNSIKHGSATKVDFLIEFENRETVYISCQDNGTRPAASGIIGLGTQLIDQCTLSWERVSNNSGTKTTLRLPFQPA
jgi:uncharacterized protein YidB (DUF937 family)